MNAGDLVWIEAPGFSGPASVTASDRDTISADMSPHFRLGKVSRKWARTIATADEIKQRNKERT